MPIGQILEFPVGFFGRCLRKNQGVNVVKVFLRYAFEGQVHILSQNVGRDVKILVLAVEQKHVRERFWREGRILQKPSKFFEAVLRVVLHVHQGLVH